MCIYFLWSVSCPHPWFCAITHYTHCTSHLKDVTEGTITPLDVHYRLAKTIQHRLVSHIVRWQWREFCSQWHQRWRHDPQAPAGHHFRSRPLYWGSEQLHATDCLNRTINISISVRISETCYYYYYRYNLVVVGDNRSSFCMLLLLCLDSR